MPKNKKGRVSASLQLQSMMIERDSGVPSNISPSHSMDDEDERESERLPTSVGTQNGTLIVYVESDIDFEDLSTSVLEPPRGKRSEGADEERVMRWLMKREKDINNAIIEKLPRSKVFHARDHAGVEKAVAHFMQMSEEAGQYLLLALDLEGIEKGFDRPAMLQLSGCVGEKEYCAVFQTRSEMAGKSELVRDVFQEGIPTRLADLLRTKKLILTGKDIAKDIEKVAPCLGLSQAEVDELAIVETSRVYGFFYALAKGGHYIEKWLRDGNSGYFEEVSLKNYLELIDEKRLIDKCPSNNNQFANFSDKNNRLVPWDKVCYAAGDAIFLTRRHIAFEVKTGIPLCCFATPISHPAIGDDLSFIEALRELAKADKDPNRVMENMSSRAMGLYEALVSARPWVKTQMEISEKSILAIRAYRSVFKRKNKIDRLPKTKGVKVRYLRHSKKRVFTATPVELHEPSVFREYHLSDDENERKNVRNGPESDHDSDGSGEFLQSARIVVSAGIMPVPLEGKGNSVSRSLLAPLVGENRIVPLSPNKGANEASESWESSSSGETSDSTIDFRGVRRNDGVDVGDKDNGFCDNNDNNNNNDNIDNDDEKDRICSDSVICAGEGDNVNVDADADSSGSVSIQPDGRNDPVDVLDVRVGSDEEFPMDIIEDSPVRFVPKVTKERFEIEYKRTDFFPQPRKSTSFPFLPEAKRDPPAIPSLLSLAFPNIRSLFNSSPAPSLVGYPFPHPYRYPPPPAAQFRPEFCMPPPSRATAPTLRPSLPGAPPTSSRTPHSRSDSQVSKAPPPNSNRPPPRSKSPLLRSTPVPSQSSVPPIDLRARLSASKAPPLPRPPPPPSTSSKRRRSPSPPRGSLSCPDVGPRAFSPPASRQGRLPIGDMDDVELGRIVRMLRIVEEREFVRILSTVRARQESARREQFIVILGAFKNVKAADRKRQYALGRAMLAILASEEREFVLQIMEGNIFEGSRLNTLCRLKYFSEVSVLLDCLLRKQCQHDFLQVAIANFPRFEVLELVEFISLHSPQEILERMRKDDAFRGDFDVQDPEWCFSEERKKEFIAFVCEKLNIDVPSVSRMLFARVRLAGEFSSYAGGRTEISDFYKICAAYAKDDPTVMRLCSVLVAGKFNPLGKFFSSMIKLPFSRDPLADDFVPSCVKNDALHGLACDRHASLSDISTVREFAAKMSAARDVAVVYHQNTIEGKKNFDFIAFRTVNRMFYYSVEQSKPMKVEIVRVLVKYPNVKVYVYKKDTAALCLRQHLGWSPKNMIDAKDVAARNHIDTRLENIAEALVGGPFCFRAMNFSGATTPSQAALRHVDMMGALIFRFCERFRERSETTDSRRGRNPQRQTEDRRPAAPASRSRSRH